MAAKHVVQVVMSKLEHEKYKKLAQKLQEENFSRFVRTALNAFEQTVMLDSGK